jgi:hypothetical protein
MRCSDNGRRGQRNVSRRKGVGKTQIKVRLILVEVNRSFGGRQREGLGLWKRSVEKEIEIVDGWTGDGLRYRCLGAGCSRVHVRCRWDGKRGRNLTVKLPDA